MHAVTESLVAGKFVAVSELLDGSPVVFLTRMWFLNRTILTLIQLLIAVPLQNECTR